MSNKKPPTSFGASFSNSDPVDFAIVGSGSRCKGPGKKRSEIAFEAYNYGFAVVEANAERLEVTFHVAERDWAWQSWSIARGPETAWQRRGGVVEAPGTPASCRDDRTCCPENPKEATGTAGS